MSGTALEPSKSIGAFPDVPDLTTWFGDQYVSPIQGKQQPSDVHHLLSVFHEAHKYLELYQKEIPSYQCVDQAFLGADPCTYQNNTWVDQAARVVFQKTSSRKMERLDHAFVET